MPTAVLPPVRAAPPNPSASSWIVSEVETIRSSSGAQRSICFCMARSPLLQLWMTRSRPSHPERQKGRQCLCGQTTRGLLDTAAREQSDQAARPSTRGTEVFGAPARRTPVAETGIKTLAQRRIGRLRGASARPPQFRQASFGRYPPSTVGVREASIETGAVATIGPAEGVWLADVNHGTFCRAV